MPRALAHSVALQNVAQLMASGSVDVEQDTLVISMTTTVTGFEAPAVQAQLKQALDTALAQARQAGVPGQLDVRTGQFSLYPRYGKDGKVNGWQGLGELVLQGRDFARITATAAKISTLTVGSVSFSLSHEQRTKAETQAQTQAIEHFKSKALDAAKSLGFTSYTLRDIAIHTADQVYTARPRMQAMQSRAEMADPAIPAEAGKTAVVVHVTGSVQMH